MTAKDIRITLTAAPKPKPADEKQLGFGRLFTDHMFAMSYTEGEDWHDPEIRPFGDFMISPAAMVFHYGQEIFEGLKAYRSADESVLLFRPEENFTRLNASAKRLCMPEIDVDFAVEALKALLRVERDWVPSSNGTSLYIRPFMISTDVGLGVHPAHIYRFFIILSPSGAYYASGLNPVKIYVESTYVRAVPGGTGEAKTGGNYASGLAAQTLAGAAGYAQVLWLDGIERTYIEEVGAMNIFFVVDGKVITPKLNGSILGGVTRKSAIALLKAAGYAVEERRISITELAEAYNAGRFEECFGTGTAAVISPVGELRWGDKVMVIGGGKIGPVSQLLYDEMTAIQWGRKAGPEGWSIKVV